MKFLWRYGSKLCNTVELIQILHAQYDKENCGDSYNSVFPGEAKKCLSFVSFRAPSVALNQKSYHNSPNMSRIITSFQVLFKFMKRHLLTMFSKWLNLFYLCYKHASFFAFFIFNKFPATWAFHMCVEYDKTKQTPSNKIWYDIYIRQILYKNTCVYVPF